MPKRNSGFSGRSVPAGSRIPKKCLPELTLPAASHKRYSISQIPCAGNAVTGFHSSRSPGASRTARSKRNSRPKRSRNTKSPFSSSGADERLQSRTENSFSRSGASRKRFEPTAISGSSASAGVQRRISSERSSSSCVPGSSQKISISRNWSEETNSPPNPVSGKVTPSPSGGNGSAGVSRHSFNTGL
ncbi:hypothetical protein SDC9_142167 [bioreactor metagenome]|uniref:Uncharacterized protein n=1 Tax=bioreactor metagenome TaxID=1076179 RepID=A0A645E0X2_9ZZZZ